MAKKYQPSQADLANDASLRWNDYRKGEAIISDSHPDQILRFSRRAGDKVYLMTLAMAELPEPVAALSIRRPESQSTRLSQEERAAIAAEASARFGSRNN